MSKSIKLSTVFGIVLMGTVLSILNNWEMGGESWGYWYFSRLLSEGGGFVVHGRSPLYTLYLTAFNWMGYPTSVTVEYMFTTMMTLFAFILLFKRFLGLWSAVFAALLWLILMQFSEPPLHKLALACSFIGLFYRLKDGHRSALVLSYTFFSLAFMFRVTYIILLLIFIAWDFYVIVKDNKEKTFLQMLRPKINDWPLAAVIIMFFSFSFWQSAHLWNNVYNSTTIWFPTGESKSLGDAGFLQVSNWEYMLQKYGTFKDHDWYFTNQELFNGANNMIDAIIENPSFVFYQLIKNIKHLFAASGQMLFISIFFSKYLLPILALVILCSAFMSSNHHDVKIFVIANVLMLISTVVVLPKVRYMFPLIPVLTLSAYWFSNRINIFFGNKWKHLIMIIILIFFSRGLKDWARAGQSFIDQFNSGKLTILENKDDSMKKSYHELNTMIQRCNGIMSLEHTFFGAFANIPMSNVYDVWEIPPFGNLNDAEYKGLKPDRIDCLLISNNLSTNTGGGTNYQVRYENYINPYAKQLIKMGAKVYKLPHYGKVVIYESTK